jgi:hypothetical protein
MDVENLAKELILKNMTPEQQMAVLDSVRQSVAQAKEVQKRKIGENVDLVVQALKKIEADIRSRYDDVGNAIEKRVASIKDGRDGINGKDGRDGKDGKAGRDGAKGDKGDAGRDGRDGVDGVDGVSVTSARIDFDGSLIIALSSGVELNVGEVVAPDLAERIKVITNGGGTSQSVLDTLASLQTQIDNLIPSQTGNAGKFLTTNGTALSWASVAGGLSYQGTWNASTNTPTLASSTGTNGYYYVVSVAGTTNLNGITDWQAGDWLIFNGSTWQKIDQSWAIAGANDNITSMTGITGGISSPDFVQFDTTATNTNSVGKLYWDDTQKTLTVGLTTNIAADIGQTLYAYVTNDEAITINKGQPVYMYSAQGDRVSVKLAYNTGDATSAKTLGVCAEDIAAGQAGLVLCQGVQDGLNLGAYTAGDTLYLGATAGTLTATKPYAPNHLVYIGVVEKANSGNGRLYVRIQNGYEMDELHNVSAQNPSNGQVLIYNASTSLWEKNTLTDGTGISITEGAGSITIANSGVLSAIAGTGISVSGATGNVTITNSAPDQTVALTGAGTTSISGTYPNFTITSNDAYTGTVTSVSGTSPVSVATGTTTPVISLAANYGDTQNPYASKTANYVLAAPNGSSGVPTFRAIVAADIPTLNQNTTGTASNVTGTVAIANGGTGQTTATAAFNALAPSQTSNSGKYLTTNGTNTSWATVSATGTVTSVAATVPSFLSISGSPITTSGTLAISYSGTALPVANGGTGVTTSTGSGSVVLGTSPTLTTPTINSAQIATVSGTAPLYLCRAWVNFNGTGTVAIRASGNVTSITDNGVGSYTVNFTNAMPDANYAIIKQDNERGVGEAGTPATGSCQVVVRANTSDSTADASYVYVAVFR